MDPKDLDAIKLLLKNKLAERDRVELAPFTLLVAQNCEMATNEQLMNNKAAILEAELNKARALVEALQQGGANATVSPTSVAALSASTIATASVSQEDFDKLKNELTEVYRRESENSRQMVDLTNENKRLSDVVIEKDKEIASLQSKCKDVETAANSRDSTIKDTKKTVEILKSELHSLQAKILTTEEELRKVVDERESLVLRWTKKVEEEALMIAEMQRERDAAVNAAAAAAAEAASGAAMAAAAAQAGASTQDKGEKKPSGILSWFSQNQQQQQQQQQPPPSKPAAPVEEVSFASSSSVPSSVSQTLVGHSGDVTGLSFNLNGTMMLSCSQDKTIRLWDTGSWSLTTTLSGATQGVNCACMSVSDDLVLGCSNDKAARIWTVAGGRLKQTLTGHQGKVLCGAFLGATGRVVTSGQDKAVRVWDANKGSGLKTMICYSTCSDLTTIPNSSLLATAHLDGNVRLWDMTHGESFSMIEKCHDGHVTCCTASPDGKWLLTCGRDNVLHLYDPTSGSRIATLSHPEYYSGTDNTRGTFSPDSRYIAVGSANGSIFVWDTMNMKHCQTLSSKTSSSPAVCVAWHPMANCFAATAKDSIDVWK